MCEWILATIGIAYVVGGVGVVMFLRGARDE